MSAGTPAVRLHGVIEILDRDRSGTRTGCDRPGGAR